MDKQMERGMKLVPPANEQDHRKGELNAPMVLVLFGDYECPFTATANSIAKELKKSLGDDLCYIYRHFPLIGKHPNSMMAAEAAEAAGEQGKFWEMHDCIFDNRYMLSHRHLVKYAKKLDLQLDTFRTLLDEHRCQPKVEEDISSGHQSGVFRTPTFFINGIRHDDSYQLEVLRETLLRSRRF